MIKTRKYFIASAECFQMKSYRGDVMTEEGRVVWLGMSEGYPSCGGRVNAHKFKSVAEIKRDARNWDGMPWCFRLKPGTLKVFNVTERKTVEVIETETKEIVGL